MAKALRQPTLETLGLGGAIGIFERGKLPVDPEETVEKVFGPKGKRGAFVISGANGIVGAGKTMQLGSRLEPYGVSVVALDLPGAPDGIGRQYPGLVRAFGREGADRVVANIVRLSYDGKSLPRELAKYQPRFLLEAIPEILELKKAHYDVFRAEFPDIEIRSVTSGFPSSQLGVGIAHPAFPHEINKLYEIVEAEPSAVTHMLLALGLVPVRVSDDWSFVLDVLFCGLTLAGLRYHRATNMPFWKMDKYIRKLLGPNPFRAHDAIGAKGANFLTWSCLFHLSKHYGELFTPTPELDERKESGQNWYPPNHFRPVVNWEMGDEEEFQTWILGPLCQMGSLLVKEKRSHLAQANIIGEICAQFRRGIIAVLRSLGPERARRYVEAYHEKHPEAAKKCWYPEALERMDTPEWMQLYVNAEHDGRVGVITIGRESYNTDVDEELNRAIDWLKAEGIENVIVTGDFHLATQLVGADTSDFYPALEHEERGFEVSKGWSSTARRLSQEFATSVGFVNGKRCLGGMLELMMHCHYVVALEDARLGMPEVTLPVVPGMEGCHWPFRRVGTEKRPELLRLLLEGRQVTGGEAVGWLVDFAGPMEKAIEITWKIATGGDHGLVRRPLEEGALAGVPIDAGSLVSSPDPKVEQARRAIVECINHSCSVPLGEALEVQAKHSAAFMASEECRRGTIGAMYERTMKP